MELARGPCVLGQLVNAAVLQLFFDHSWGRLGAQQRRANALGTQRVSQGKTVLEVNGRVCTFARALVVEWCAYCCPCHALQGSSAASNLLYVLCAG